MHGVAGVDQQVAGGMLDEDASGGHREGIACEGAAGFDPASGEIFQRSDARRYAGMRWSGGKRVSMEIQDIGADADENGQEHEQDCGATQPHTDTIRDQCPPKLRDLRECPMLILSTVPRIREWPRRAAILLVLLAILVGI